MFNSLKTDEYIVGNKVGVYEDVGTCLNIVY